VTDARQHDTYRPQLDGIRAVAVVLVILFHLGYGWIPGGFVGVDVFFVLSGYLITGLLVDELARDGRIDLARFYARRVRRLLPAAVLVVAVVIVGTVGLLDRVDQTAVRGDATSSALYVANWHFGLTEGDYFAPGDVPSPLVHFWSLAVEEQFYVVWPALLMLLWLAATRWCRGALVGGAVLAAVLVLTAASAALSVLLEPGPLSYYGTHTRAYQLLAGAALAIAARHWLRRAPGAAAGSAGLRATGALLGVAALAALAALAHEVAGAQGYPGFAALGVTSASLALIAALDLMGEHPLRRVAGARLPAAVGRLSYSLYLWHWPVIVFLPVLGERLDTSLLGHELALVAAMTALATISYRLWEQPIRFRIRRRAPARRVVVVGLAASAALSLSAIPLLQAPSGFESRALASVRDMAQPGRCPYFARDWPADPGSARACVQRTGRGPTVALVGDSHAQQWQPALLALAERHDLTIVRATRGGCPANDVTVDRGVDPLGLTGSGEQCAAWRRQVYADLVERHDPDVVLVATRSHVSAIADGGRRIEPFTRDHRRRWSAAWDWTLKTLGAAGARVVVSEILPTLPERVPACLADAGEPTTACDFPVAGDRRVGAYNAIVRGLSRRADGVTVVDPTPIGCPGGICRALAGDVVVHRDDNHLSAAFVRSRARSVEALLRRAGANLAAGRPARP
jgi:peptidoglycan/LPS O-acetylase OafA/YrhL